MATIKQASGVIFSFLRFSNQSGTNSLKITRQDIGEFVEHEQHRGLKIDSVISNLRDVYIFINFLVEREILPQTINSEKIRVKMHDRSPRAIPEKIKTVLLSEISNIRNRA